jgi:hypothetical protein
MSESSEPDGGRGGAYPRQTEGTAPDADADETRPASERRPGTSTTEDGRNIERDDEADTYP